MSATSSKDDFRHEATKYWSGDYQNDSRGAQTNAPQAYAQADRERFRFLYDKILSYSPSSVLEVGCNAGGHLNHLKQLRPNLKVAGIELNSRAIETASSCFDTSDWTLINGNALDESTWEQISKKYDVIFTCVFLIHISPGADKKYVIEKLLKTAGKALVMYESHSESEVISDARKDKSHSPYCIDNYTKYADFNIQNIEAMRDYPGMHQALISKRI